ncbi:hypothetical protein BVRB_027600, partial [Beta vulgaris subsp. vulgaris]
DHECGMCRTTAMQQQRRDAGRRTHDRNASAGANRADNRVDGERLAGAGRTEEEVEVRVRDAGGSEVCVVNGGQDRVVSMSLIGVQDLDRSCVRVGQYRLTDQQQRPAKPAAVRSTRRRGQEPPRRRGLDLGTIVLAGMGTRSGKTPATRECGRGSPGRSTGRSGPELVQQEVPTASDVVGGG